MYLFHTLQFAGLNQWKDSLPDPEPLASHAGPRPGKLTESLLQNAFEVFIAMVVFPLPELPRIMMSFDSIFTPLPYEHLIVIIVS